MQAYNVSETQATWDIASERKQNSVSVRDRFSIGLSAIDRLAGFPIIPGEIHE